MPSVHTRESNWPDRHSHCFVFPAWLWGISVLPTIFWLCSGHVPSRAFSACFDEIWVVGVFRVLKSLRGSMGLVRWKLRWRYRIQLCPDWMEDHWRICTLHLCIARRCFMRSYSHAFGSGWHWRHALHWCVAGLNSLKSSASHVGSIMQLLCAQWLSGHVPPSFSEAWHYCNTWWKRSSKFQLWVRLARLVRTRNNRTVGNCEYRPGTFESRWHEFLWRTHELGRSIWKSCDMTINAESILM